MKINILTLFPEMFTAVTESSILGRAGERGILDIRLINIRDFSKDKHNKADDYPFGGGVGMVMLPQPVFDALRSLETDRPAEASGESGDIAAEASGKTEGKSERESAGESEEKSEEKALATPTASAPKSKMIYMSPRGKILDREKIEELAALEEITILCGHYEGVDQRIIDEWDMEEISIGDYILTGGELAAMVLVDSVSRFIPEVLGTKESATEESVYSGLLEYDQYTKPREYEGLTVPEVLVSGNHKRIHLWQYENSLRLTKERRPDLLAAYLEKPQNLENLTKEEKKILAEFVSKA